jgi:hypothetical protein
MSGYQAAEAYPQDAGVSNTVTVREKIAAVAVHPFSRSVLLFSIQLMIGALVAVHIAVFGFFFLRAYKGSAESIKGSKFA